MSSLSSQHGAGWGWTYLPGPTLPTPHSSRVPTMTLHASTCLSYQDAPWTRVVHPHQTSLVRPVFPVTRQVRRKRTRVFRSVGARGGNERRRAGASGRAVAQNWGARAPRVGLGRDKGGLGGETRVGMGRDEVGVGETG